jgi:hypothetical protein
MPAKPYGRVLIGVCLLLSGCLYDHTAERVAELRKSGDPVAARAKALEALAGDPDRMNVWRELAATDLDLARTAVRSDSQSLPLLLEAGLICAAVGNHSHGKVEERWRVVGMLAASEIANYAGHLANQLEIRTVGRTVYEESGWVPDDIPEEDIPPNFRQEIREVYIDPQLLGEVIHQTVCCMILLKQLPSDNPKVTAITLNQLDEKLQWASANSNISTSFVNSRRETAERNAQQALADAVLDLDVHGYFYGVTIFQSGMLE